MPKKRKLKLSSLKVESFVTNLKDRSHLVKMKGGAISDTPIPCGTPNCTDTCETPCGSCDTCATECTCGTCVTCETCDCGGSGYKTCHRPWECTLDC